MHRALAYSLWIFGLLMHPVIIRGTLDARQDDIPVIIGGTILPDRRQSPWMVYLASDYGFIDMPCGGSLVSKSVILTAAQCVTFSFSDPGVFLKAQRVLYVLGGLTSKPDDETEEVYGWQDDPTNAIVVHPWYLGLKSLHDVALVKMSSAVTLTPYIGLVQLTSPGCNPEGLDVGVIGWGKTETDGPSAKLLYTNTKVRMRAVCNSYYNCEDGAAPYFNGDWQVCLAGNTMGAVCTGDNGGPVVKFVTDPDNPPATIAVQIAINSFGKTRNDRTGPCPTSTSTQTPTSTSTQTPTTSTSTQVPTTSTSAQVPTTSTDSSARTTARSGTQNNKADKGAALLQLFRTLFGSSRNSRSRSARAVPFCQIDAPSVGTKIAPYRDWIDAVASQLVNG